MSNLTIEELEKRMRPGQYSQGGFLGLNESLETIITQDSKTLEKFGINHEQIAAALEKIVTAAREQEEALPYEERFKRRTDFPNLYRPEKNPLFSRASLPDLNLGYRVGRFQVFFVLYRGFQVCPWDECGDMGGFDFMILNRDTGESITAPALIIHLIRAHHFFEGADSPYRVDPGKVIRILELS